MFGGETECTSVFKFTLQAQSSCELTSSGANIRNKTQQSWLLDEVLVSCYIVCLEKINIFRVKILQQLLQQILDMAFVVDLRP